jgi:hypothetical protein
MTIEAQVAQVRWAGPYTDGEIPLPFTVKFDPSDIDFAGFNVSATIEEEDGTELAFAGNVDWNSPDADGIDIGKVRVDLGAADVAKATSSEIETKRMQIWAGDGGTNLVATVIVKFTVRPAVGTAPTP